MKNIKNFTIENSINKNYFKDNLYSKDKIKLNKIIKNVYTDLNEVKNTFHILSKKFNLEFKKSNLKKFNKYQTVVLIGMGGSVLGTQAIYTFLKQGIKKKFIFFDNLDQLKIEKTKKEINFKKNLFIIISKSGNTIETLINSNLFKDKINSKNSIIITEEEKNLLNIFAKKKKNTSRQSQKVYRR